MPLELAEGKALNIKFHQGQRSRGPSSLFLGRDEGGREWGKSLTKRIY